MILRRRLGVKPTDSARVFAEEQWRLLLEDTLEASMCHLHHCDDLKREYRPSKTAHTVMLSSTLRKMRSEGALLTQERLNTSLLMDNQYKNWRPICDSESVRLLECENYVFSDSVLLLGKKGTPDKGIKRYNDSVNWLSSSSDVRLKTIHGRPFQYHWDITKGITTAKMLPRIKKLIDDKAGGEPKQFPA